MEDRKNRRSPWFSSQAMPRRRPLRPCVGPCPRFPPPENSSLSVWQPWLSPKREDSGKPPTNARLSDSPLCRTWAVSHACRQDGRSSRERREFPGRSRSASSSGRQSHGKRRDRRGEPSLRPRQGIDVRRRSGRAAVTTRWSARTVDADQQDVADSFAVVRTAKIQGRPAQRIAASAKAVRPRPRVTARQQPGKPRTTGRATV